MASAVGEIGWDVGCGDEVTDVDDIGEDVVMSPLKFLTLERIS